ncbi:TIGR03826 family flagellar region protein [Bacillus sp. V59.32b]|uniref:TIGR03826 family flagellar region protein n=1 Tax=Bacillus sp. V59.32b TaxID=1758642 RepID=UPI00268AA667
MELTNCPNCDTLFVKSKFRDVCESCYKEEEKNFEKVYQFIRKRENRSALMPQVVEATGVDEDLIIKFIKTGKLRVSQFPNLGTPCEKCGKVTQNGRMCDDCSGSLRSELKQFEKEETRRLEIEKRDKSATYYTHKK